MAKTVTYAVVMLDAGAQFYAGDVVSYGMSIPTFTDNPSDMLSYSDIDDAWSQADRLHLVYPESFVTIARFVADE